MRIITPPDFISKIKNKHLLLDTNVFIDTSLHEEKFGKFLNELKNNGVTLLTLEVVMIEFTKGAPTKEKFNTKKTTVEKIVDTYLPLTKEILENSSKLAKLYGEEGKGTNIVDFLLGGALVQYEDKLLLMTKDIKDFPAKIFKLETHFLLQHNRAIQNYGIYTYISK